ncbi:DegT/DnrJ/EryC1/StrS family aminotransferase [Helicobacter turcicus]|uniref:DegT/DnrJ/EryC1/StrS family aminotransferase n=1 Tax=Helicobacter turcicus TaxID=2867412 RepID=A0ABS7JQ20_9HELI|nr:DegT/DnrJ/EryC1/StrS family aminotransferase [Helicobacter turcicus]MBX7491501.1 DegT/DnrJ/EryC1/StrS family aminotransferase [Helicobacter turcicus]MBX7546357.1 DegT/DnrJ/EryC1/StrS family aminotransferase [Helicobacter turcicus]
MIDFANLKKAHLEQKQAIEEAVLRVCRNANYIMGEEVKGLEQELVEFVGGGYAVTCGSGSDALLLALMALGIQAGDEVITPPFSFIATSEMIALLGAKPVFVDISLEDFNIDCALIENAITPKTKAILAVSLYGQPPDLERLEFLARKWNLKLILDGAQSFGAEFKGIKDSLYGDVATTSFFPSKPLGCYGDGGAIFTRNGDLAEKIACLRVHGQTQRYLHKYVGIGGRLDALQAAILRIKLRAFKETIQRRQEVAKWYDGFLGNCVKIPRIIEGRVSVYAQYTIQTNQRCKLQEHLKKYGIPSVVHYPLGLHLQECFKDLSYQKGDFKKTEIASCEVLSLPMNPCLRKEEVKGIAQVIKEWFNV